MSLPKKQPNGAIIYRGPSQLDGAPIVVIAIGLNITSENRKTGNMIQTYIIRDDMTPIAAVHAGKDDSICGDCVHRGDGKGKKRTCYVNLGQGPLIVFNTFMAGGYPDISGDSAAVANIARGRLVRIGTYGDGAAAPLYVWDDLTQYAIGHTGYTHQWKTRPELQQYCMASVDTESESIDARLAGWRTFRVALPGHVAKLEKESVCPASKEAGKKLTCDVCLACDGTASNRKGSIVIQAHGGTAVMVNIQRMAA